jgi:hypothetical protein
VSEVNDQRNIEEAVADLKTSTARYASGKASPSTEVVADLTRAIHDLSDHLVDLHRRIKKIEDSQDEWTTRGWLPPPGSDSTG